MLTDLATMFYNVQHKLADLRSAKLHKSKGALCNLFLHYIYMTLYMLIQKQNMQFYTCIKNYLFQLQL